MKSLNILFFTLLSFASLLGCSAEVGLHTTDLNKKSVQRELLKEYFLYACIRQCYKDCQISYKDASSAVYLDILNYNPEVFRELDEYAEKMVSSIEPTPLKDLDNRKAFFLILMDRFKSKELDKYIKRMDKYMLK